MYCVALAEASQDTVIWLAPLAFAVTLEGTAGVSSADAKSIGIEPRIMATASRTEKNSFVFFMFFLRSENFLPEMTLSYYHLYHKIILK